MSGPSTKRTDINSASLPGLTDPLQGLLKGFLQSGGQLPSTMGQPSALQQQSSNAFSNLLNQGNPGAGVIDAAQPIFQRNLQLGADTLRQAGPRFASNTERLVGNQGTQAMQDFNLFQQNVLQQGQQQQLANLMGAGNFANAGAAQQQALIQQLLGMSGSLGAGPAVLQQNKGGLANIFSALGTAANLGNAFGGMFKPSGSNAGDGSDMGALTGGRGGQTGVDGGSNPGEGNGMVLGSAPFGGGGGNSSTLNPALLQQLLQRGITR